MKLKDIKYKILPFVIGAAPVFASCDGNAFHGVACYKADNKIYMAIPPCAVPEYTINCKYLPGGMGLYENIIPGDTVYCKYNCNNNSVYVSVLPDTVARYTISCNGVAADSVVSKIPNAYSVSDSISECIMNELARDYTKMLRIKYLRTKSGRGVKGL